MKTIDFDYYMPKNLIAQFPSEKRDDCRLLCLDRRGRSLSHRRFEDLPALLKAGDRLIFNDTKVLPARVICRKATGAVIELLFTECIDKRSWKALVKPVKRIKTNSLLSVDKEPSIRLRLDSALHDGAWIVSLQETPLAFIETIEDLLQRFGEMPLPHYISRKPQHSDNETYQTVFARKPGAIASPTAGLHFTERLLNRLKETGISFSFVTLHVGIGTFRPVIADDPREHRMHEERFVLSAQTAKEINETRIRGGRNIAIGTTVVRVLEHCSIDAGFPVASSASTHLMILPGFAFKTIDGMITNFHVPRSTLLMLVCAFSDKEFIFNAYQTAIKERYRFFSYGDAMLIL